MGATNSMITQSTPMIALNRVKTLARTMSVRERLLRTGTSLTWPRATRSATCALVSPVTGDVTVAGGAASVRSPASRCVMQSTVRADLVLHPPEKTNIRPGEDGAGSG